MPEDKFPTESLSSKLISLLSTGIIENQCSDCCIDCGEIYVLAGQEKYVTLVQELGGDGGTNIRCCTETCLKEIQEIVGEDAYNILLNKGFFEYSSLEGKSYLCDVLEYAKQNNASPQDVFDLVQAILNIGIVIYCNGEDRITASIETFLQYAEGVGLLCEPPLDCPLSISDCCLKITSSINGYLAFSEAIGGGDGPTP